MRFSLATTCGLLLLGFWVDVSQAIPTDSSSSSSLGSHHSSRTLAHIKYGFASPSDTQELDSSTPTYTSVVVFGASYCDNAHPRPSQYNGSLRPPPYYQGRYSNGLIFAEYLASFVDNATLLDYAYGGAQALNSLTYSTVPDTRTQMETFLSQVTAGTADRGPGRSLVLWWIGINPLTQIWTDAIKAGATNGNKSAEEHATARVQQEIQEVLLQVKAVQRNKAVNKIPTNILLLPIPPLEIVPNLYYQALSLASQNATLGAQYLSYIGTLTAQYNDGLTNAVPKLGVQDRTSHWIRTYDIVSLWRDVKANPSNYGFTNVTNPCLDPSTNIPCSEPAQYEYWDTLHPTTAFHKIIATKLASVAMALTG